MNWIWFLIWGLTTILFSYYVFRVIVRREYQEKKRLRPLVTLLEILVVCLYFGYAWALIPVDWPEVHVGVLQQVIGLPLFVIGFGMGFSHMFWLGIWRASGWQVDGLQQPGLYRYTRNPQVVLIGLGILGYVIVWQIPFGLGWFAVYWLTFHWMVLSEEEHLRDVYGEIYEEYCGRVPRYIMVND